MKAIVWDDEFDVPGRDTMKRLVAELLLLGVECTVVATPDELKKQVIRGNERYDFVLTDWLDGSRIPAGEARGKDIVVGIRRAGKTMPIFVLSTIAEKLDADLLGLGKPLFIKSKDVQVPFLAIEIVDQLEILGRCVDPKKVFVIYGHDRGANGSKKQLITFIEALGLEPVLVEPWRGQYALVTELQRHMNGCSAFVAICTPDDCVEEGRQRHKKWCQPRQNVLFELGIAYGLGRGPERLCILQQSIEGDPDQFARLPSDLDGYLTLRFTHNVEERFPELKKRFEMLGLAINSAGVALPVSGSP